MKSPNLYPLVSSRPAAFFPRATTPMIKPGLGCTFPVPYEEEAADAERPSPSSSPLACVASVRTGANSTASSSIPRPTLPRTILRTLRSTCRKVPLHAISGYGEDIR